MSFQVFFYRLLLFFFFFFFFFNDTATTEISPLSLHAALPISRPACWLTRRCSSWTSPHRASIRSAGPRDRKSTRLNSRHSQISYAVFCLKKKKKQKPKSIIELKTTKKTK